MQLNTFVTQYIPAQLRRTRDFTGDRGWCYLATQILRRLAAGGILDLNQLKELPVVPTAGPGSSELRYITPPSGFIRVIDIYKYGQEYTKFNHELIDGKIKLTEEYDDTVTVVSGWEVFGATTTQAELVMSGTAIAEEDDACKDLAVTFALPTTPVSILGLCRLITGSMYSPTPSRQTCDWSDALPAAPTVAASQATLYRAFLMLKCFCGFTSLSAADDELPIDDQFEALLGFGMSWLAATGSDVESVAKYKALYEDELKLFSRTVFTPTEEQARPQPRQWPTFSDEHGRSGGGYTNVQHAGDEL